MERENDEAYNEVLNIMTPEQKDKFKAEEDKLLKRAQRFGLTEFTQKIDPVRLQQAFNILII
jgi:hypothetical protein